MRSFFLWLPLWHYSLQMLEGLYLTEFLDYEKQYILSVIGTNSSRGIIPERLTVNRRIGIGLRKGYLSMYSLRWEIERTFFI
jgi:hypothetical protein